jgi:nucleotide-binding universal stress UspA family protein
MEIRKIIVPVDFSDHSRKAMDTAVGLAKQFGATVHLLHSYPIFVGDLSPYAFSMPANLDRDVRDAAATQLGEWADKVRAEGVGVETTLTPTPACQATVELASEIHADLIVMGTRGLSGLKHVMLGSVAERTVRLAPCPVLTVKGKG